VVKVLVAVADTPRPRDGDFNFATPGEVLALSVLICRTPERRAECGCDRSFAGVDSSKATTYARVAELGEAEAAALASSFPDSSRVAGWPGLPLERRAAILWQEIVELSALIDAVSPGAEVRIRSGQDDFELVCEDGTRLARQRVPGLTAIIDATLLPRSRAITTRRILDGVNPVLLVTHEHDGWWQFLDGGEFERDGAVAVHAGHVLSEDLTLLELADLPRGWEAERAAVGEPWQRYEWCEEDDAA
jgi:hypothetical protein